MEGAGRFQTLAIQAYIRKALDFEQPSRYDPRKRLKEELVLDQLYLDNLKELSRLRSILHSSAAGAGGEAYKHHFDHAAGELKFATSLYLPWADVKNTSANDMDQYVKMWEESFGIKVGSKEWKKINRKYQKLNELYLNKDR